MDDELDRLVISVRADTQAFASDVMAMRDQLDGALGAGAERAGRRIETALERAVRTGKFGFDDLKRVAIGVLSDIARASAGTSGGGSGGGGLIGLATTLLSSLFGSPGRATGGPVTGGRAYMVGERGPELFVPGSGGRIEAGFAPTRGPVSITVNVAAPAEGAAGPMARTGHQVARAVRRALERADG